MPYIRYDIVLMSYGIGVVMAKKGRPVLYEADSFAMKAFSVRLSVIHERRAMKLGKGNLSEGIRLALETVTRKEVTVV